MIMEDVDTCKLCMETFGDKSRPRVLHCGHTFCTCCIDRLIENRSLLCPRCQQSYNVAGAKDFSINYDLEESLSNTKLTQSYVSQDEKKDKKITKMETIITEQRISTHNLILTADEIESQLDEYHEFLLEKEKKHEELLQKIRELANHHEVIAEGIKEERKKILKAQEEGFDYRKEVKDKLPSLDNAKSNRDAVAAVADLDDRFSQLEEWTERCQKEFPDAEVVSSTQFLTASVDGISLAFSGRVEEVTVASDFPDNDWSIMEKAVILGVSPILTRDELRLKPEHWKAQIVFGEVYAIQTRNKVNRFARLSRQTDRIYLHHLEDLKLPPRGRAVKHSDLLSFLDQDSVLAFMDLAWNGSCQGRVHVLLSPDTPLARQFRILCTGDLGPSYAHTKFCQVLCKGKTNETIRGGDYESNNGTGGMPILEGLNRADEIYNRRFQTGTVFVTEIINKSQIAQFTIVTGSATGQSKGVFGQVTEGIEVVRAAAELQDISEVEIIDCGVMLPL